MRLFERLALPMYMVIWNEPIWFGENQDRNHTYFYPSLILTIVNELAGCLKSRAGDVVVRVQMQKQAAARAHHVTKCLHLRAVHCKRDIMTS